MVNFSQDEKIAFLTSSNKYLTLEFSDGTVLDNDDIKSECMKLVQTLCDESSLKFGKVSSNVFSVEIFAPNKKYKGLKVTPKLDLEFYLDDSLVRKEFILGTFQVESEKKSADMSTKTLTCYDSSYYWGKLNVADWYNGLTFPITIKKFRDSFFKHIGIEQETISLPNDSIKVEKTIDTSSLLANTVIESICELNACFGNMNESDKFEYVRLNGQDDALFPSNDLYPSDDLFPKDYITEVLTQDDYFQNGAYYEDYECLTPTKVCIREDSEDLGTSKGGGNVTYYITGNFLLNGADATVKGNVIDGFRQWCDFIPYKQSDVNGLCRPWIRPGDSLRVLTNYGSFITHVLKRTISGISNLADMYVSKGTENFNESESLTQQITSLRNATVKLKQDTDGIKSEVSKKVGEKEVESIIEQNADSIRLKADSIVVDSENFKVTKDGFVYMQDIFVNVDAMVGSYVDSVTRTDITATYKLYSRGAFTTLEVEIVANKQIGTSSGITAILLPLPEYFDVVDSYGETRKVRLSSRGTLKYQYTSDVTFNYSCPAVYMEDEKGNMNFDHFMPTVSLILYSKTASAGSKFTSAFNFFNWGVGGLQWLG